jgi:hypothetical protein
MAYVHGYTTADNVLLDLTKVLGAGDKLTPANNWKVVYPANALNMNLELTITAGASASGNVTVTIDSVKSFSVAVTSGDTSSAVATKIATAIDADADYTATAVGSVVTIASVATKVDAKPAFNGASTGVIGSVAENGSIVDEVVFQVNPEFDKVWVKQEPQTISVDGKITLTFDLATDAGTRVYVRDKKYHLYLTEGKTQAELDIMEYEVTGTKELTVNVALAGKEVLVDYEKQSVTTSTFFVDMKKPAKTDDGTDNHYYIEWRQGTSYDPITNTFPADHDSEYGRWYWYKDDEVSHAFAKGWLPIEYWITFDKNAGTGVLMGDPGLSNGEWLSSPAYFGALKQIDGALDTDLVGNFATFAGSFKEPTLSKRYGDYTGTGVTDAIMTASKTGRPFQAHKLQFFGGYEFREKTFNGQSAHTLKHAVSDIVLADVHENDRGILHHCLAVPRVAKEHGTELVYNRYMSGKEETYIFLNINSPYSPFQTSPDVLIGFAIRTDI